jgi:hypothetical protein
MPRKARPKRLCAIKAHVTEAEYARLKADATRFNFTMSDYVRRIVTAFKIPQSVVNAQARLDLLQINADLARLGNLFKMALNGEGFHVTEASLRKLMADVEATRQLLLDQIHTLSRK